MEAVHEIIRGVLLPARAAWLIYFTPSLLVWSLLPVLAVALVLLVLFLCGIGTIDITRRLIWMALEYAGFDTSETHSWTGLAGMGVTTVLALVIILIVLVTLYYVFVLLSTTIASPFLSILSNTVEEYVIETEYLGPSTKLVAALIPKHPTDFRSQLNANVYIVGQEILAALVYVSLSLALLFMTLFPLVAPVTAALQWCLTCFFALHNLSAYVCERRMLSFRQRVRMYARRWAVCAGFSSVAACIMLVPVLNLLALPTLVVSATLLVMTMEAERLAEHQIRDTKQE